MSTIIEEKRDIASIYFEDSDEFTAGLNRITKIVPYKECGQMGYITWFEIWKGNFLWQRVNGSFICGVKYKKEGVNNG